MTKLIVAKGLNNEIGKDNGLIWRLPRDMRFFTETTRGNIVLMGRKNWDSIPLKFRPLPGRVNGVVTRNEDFDVPDCLVFPSVEVALEYFDNKEDRDVFIIGGGEIYKYCLRLGVVEEMFITEVKESFEADTFFPDFDESEWSKDFVFSHKADETNAYSFEVFHYKKKR